MELLLQTARTSAIVATIGTSELVAPDLITVEVVSTLRRLLRQDLVLQDRADEAVADLIAAPVRHLPTSSLTHRIWSLRDNLSAYDACYVALAEVLGCSVISGDARLSRAPGLRVPVIVP